MRVGAWLRAFSPDDLLRTKRLGARAQGAVFQETTRDNGMALRWREMQREAASVGPPRSGDAKSGAVCWEAAMRRVMPLAVTWRCKELGFSSPPDSSTDGVFCLSTQKLLGGPPRRVARRKEPQNADHQTGVQRHNAKGRGSTRDARRRDGAGGRAGQAAWWLSMGRRCVPSSGRGRGRVRLASRGIALGGRRERARVARQDTVSVSHKGGGRRKRTKRGRRGREGRGARAEARERQAKRLRGRGEPESGSGRGQEKRKVRDATAKAQKGSVAERRKGRHE